MSAKILPFPLSADALMRGSNRATESFNKWMHATGLTYWSLLRADNCYELLESRNESYYRTGQTFTSLNQAHRYVARELHAILSADTPDNPPQQRDYFKKVGESYFWPKLPEGEDDP